MLITLAAVFFAITFLILGGVFVVAFLVMLYAVAVLLHYIYSFLLRGTGNLERMIQSSLYSGAVLLATGLIFALMLLTKYAGLEFSLFRVGFHVIYAWMLLYVYGLWAVAGRKIYGVTKWQAFVGAVIPVVLLLIFGFVFDKIALCRLEQWIV